MLKLTAELAAILKTVSLLNDMPFKPDWAFRGPAPGEEALPLLSIVTLK
ncbi:hypothetical protein BVZ80_00246 [Haemophilus influenzae]|nr:hypothetical protein BVZ80_00246 [Haemophilus influenzae]